MNTIFNTQEITSFQVLFIVIGYFLLLVLVSFLAGRKDDNKTFSVVIELPGGML